MANPTIDNQKRTFSSIEKIILGFMFFTNTIVMTIAITMVDSVLMRSMAAILLFLVPIVLVFIVQKFPCASDNMFMFSSSISDNKGKANNILHEPAYSNLPGNIFHHLKDD